MTSLQNLMSMIVATVSSRGLNNVGPKQTPMLAAVIWGQIQFGAFINDVIQILRFLTSHPPSAMLKWMFAYNLIHSVTQINVTSFSSISY